MRETIGIRTLNNSIDLNNLYLTEGSVSYAVDGNTLKPIENPANHDYIVACVATWAGKVRLIDNLILKGELQMN